MSIKAGAFWYMIYDILRIPSRDKWSVLIVSCVLSLNGKYALKQ